MKKISNLQSPISDYRGGFTLVELLVAITLFAIAVSIAVGGFTRALRTQRQLIGLIAANSNASLSIEQMARELRVGADFKCASVPVSPCTEIQFTDPNGNVVRYRYDPQSNSIQKGNLAGDFEPFTADNVSIQYLDFIIGPDLSLPPRITIVLGVSANITELKGNVTRLQTTVSSRQ